MDRPRSSGADLGGTLAVVKPHPVSVLFGCIPGLVMALVLLSNNGMSDIRLLFHPEIELPAGLRPFLWCWLLLTLFLLGMGLRHIFDRAELCQEGFRFLGKAYRFDEMGPISWSHNSQNGLTRFADRTTMNFRCQGKQVRLTTRYLQDLSYQYHRAYAVDPAGAPAAISRAVYTNSAHHPR